MPPINFSINAADVSALILAFAANLNDLGVGLVNIKTGEIRLGSFDLVTHGQGHQGLADALGIVDGADWRGFTFSVSGRFADASHFNLPDGGLKMLPVLASLVHQALKLAGLVN